MSTEESLIVRLVADWDCSHLMDLTPGGTGVWDGIQFTVDAVACDYLVMMNNRKWDAVTAVVPPENVWALMQEPAVPALYDWLIEGHDAYARVLSHLATSRSGKYTPSHPAIPWHVGLSYDELVSARIPEKTACVSWITSDLTFLPGQRMRNILRQALAQDNPDLVDLYGRGIRPVARKWDVLVPYKYSLAIENASGPNLWTEKIADCFLSWTLPFYYGCTNLEEYFPAESFIRIDAADPTSAIATIRQAVAKGEWERRLPAIEIARNLILEKYALFPHLANMIRHDRRESGPRMKVTIPGYRQARWRHVARYLTQRYITGKIKPSDGVDLRYALSAKWKTLFRSG